MKYQIFFLKDKPELINTCSKYIYSYFKDFYHQLGFYSSDQISNELINKYLNTSRLPLTIVAVSNDNNFLGCVTLEYEDMNIRSDLSPWISDLYVVPNYRNKGIGRYLIQFIIQIAKRLKIIKIYLWTEDKHIFFRNIGFKDIDKEDINYLNHWVRIMSLDLDNYKKLYY